MGSLDAVGAAHPAFISGDFETQERAGVQSMTPQYRKGKLSRRGVGLLKGVTLGGRVGGAPGVLPLQASCGRGSSGSGPRQAWGGGRLCVTQSGALEGLRERWYPV